MADFPTSVYNPRTIENRNGVTYDSTKKKVLYAEDIQKLNDEVVAIETYLETGSVAGPVIVKKVSLTSAEILALFSSPKTLIPAVGSGKICNILKITARFNWNSVAYATNLNLKVCSVATSLVHFYTTTLLGSTASKIVTNWNLTIDAVSASNEGIYLAVATGNPTAGNSTMDIYITYQIITL